MTWCAFRNNISSFFGYHFQEVILYPNSKTKDLNKYFEQTRLCRKYRIKVNKIPKNKNFLARLYN